MLQRDPVGVQGFVQCSEILIRSSDILRGGGPVVDVVMEKLVGRVCRIIRHLNLDF